MNPPRAHRAASALSLAPLLALLLAFGVTASGCRSGKERRSPPPDPEVADELDQFLPGWFSSVAQAADDPNFLEVRLVIVPIWEHRRDGHWFYVEQARESALDRPYRQRIYRLVAEEGGARSEVFTLPNPDMWIGGWRVSGLFDTIGRESLTPRPGCDVHLTETAPNRYIGGTAGKGCASDLRGSVFATSEVMIEPGRISSWDRGFDGNENQVWGSTEGPYHFDLITREMPD